MSGLATWFAVAAGGAVGAMMRFLTAKLALRFLGPNFPWGTLTVNIVGSVAMGALIAWLARTEPHNEATRAFFAVGLLGAFTTFSSFALDAVTLYERKALTAAAIYVAASVLLSLAGLVAGLRLGRVI